MAAQISGSVKITKGSETELLSAVAYVGPVSVAVDANNNAFRVSVVGRLSGITTTSAAL